MAYNLGRIDPDEPTGYYDDGNVEDEVRPPRRIWRIGTALLVMAAFAGGLWAAYVAGTRHGGVSEPGDVPLIRADTSPYKVKPQSPGGMAIPDRALLIYGAQRPQVEHLLPPPEQPMARPAPPPPSPLPPSPAQPQTASAAPSAPAPSAMRPNSVEAVNASPAPPSAAAAASPSAPAPDLIAERIDRLEAAPTDSAAGAAPASGTPAKIGGLRLQLGAVRRSSEARDEWERLKRSNADLLGKLSAVAVRADLGDKGVYYRIQAGPVASPTIAERICGELRQRRLACIIVH
jgi:SPOR domain